MLTQFTDSAQTVACLSGLGFRCRVPDIMRCPGIEVYVSRSFVTEFRVQWVGVKHGVSVSRETGLKSPSNLKRGNYVR